MTKISQRTTSLLIVALFVLTSVKVPVYARPIDSMAFMPTPGVMVATSREFKPAFLKGIVVHPENPLTFDFIIYKGDKPLSDKEKREEYTKLAKYFLASLAIPDDDQWVNLSPYEKGRIIKEDFGKTQMGRDLLREDYMLKQITASLIYPEDEIGKKFWKRVYQEAAKKFGTTNVAVNTFNKVWIVPERAVVYENSKAGTAYVVESRLKVMLEEDYLALAKNQRQPGDRSLALSPSRLPNKDTSTTGSQIIREIVIPQLEKEVNEGGNFAALRQVYSGMLLAAWYKRSLKESLLNKIYSDKAKVKGVDYRNSRHGGDIEFIYRQYLKAYKKGVFNFIKEDVDRYTHETMPRKYFSGGAVGYTRGMGDYAQVVRTVSVMPPQAGQGVIAGQFDLAQVAAKEPQGVDAAMGESISIQSTARLLFAELVKKIGRSNHPNGPALWVQPSDGAPPFLCPDGDGVLPKAELLKLVKDIAEKIMLKKGVSLVVVDKMDRVGLRYKGLIPAPNNKSNRKALTMAVLNELKERIDAWESKDPAIIDEKGVRGIRVVLQYLPKNVNFLGGYHLFFFLETNPKVKAIVSIPADSNELSVKGFDYVFKLISGGATMQEVYNIFQKHGVDVLVPGNEPPASTNHAMTSKIFKEVKDNELRELLLKAKLQYGSLHFEDNKIFIKAKRPTRYLEIKSYEKLTDDLILLIAENDAIFIVKLTPEGSGEVSGEINEVSAKSDSSYFRESLLEAELRTLPNGAVLLIKPGTISIMRSSEKSGLLSEAEQVFTSLKDVEPQLLLKAKSETLRDGSILLTTKSGRMFIIRSTPNGLVTLNEAIELGKEDCRVSTKDGKPSLAIINKRDWSVQVAQQLLDKPLLWEIECDLPPGSDADWQEDGSVLVKKADGQKVLFKRWPDGIWNQSPVVTITYDQRRARQLFVDSLRKIILKASSSGKTHTNAVIAFLREYIDKGVSKDPVLIEQGEVRSSDPVLIEQGEVRSSKFLRLMYIPGVGFRLYYPLWSPYASLHRYDHGLAVMAYIEALKDLKDGKKPGDVYHKLTPFLLPADGGNHKGTLNKNISNGGPDRAMNVGSQPDIPKEGLPLPNALDHPPEARESLPDLHFIEFLLEIVRRGNPFAIKGVRKEIIESFVGLVKSGKSSYQPTIKRLRRAIDADSSKAPVFIMKKNFKGVIVSLRYMPMIGYQLSFHYYKNNMPGVAIVSISKNYPSFAVEQFSHALELLGMGASVGEVQKIINKDILNFVLDQAFGLIDPSLGALNSASADSAMAKGGIDFNAAHLNLQIKRDGRGVPLPISQQDLNNIHLDGLIPIVIAIKPAAEMMSLLFKPQLAKTAGH